jgi:hypothetical protein
MNNEWINQHQVLIFDSHWSRLYLHIITHAAATCCLDLREASTHHGGRYAVNPELPPIHVTPVSSSTLDYRGENGLFLVTASYVTISKPKFAFQRWNGALCRDKKLKKYLSRWARCEKGVGGISFTNKWKAEILQRGLQLDNFKLSFNGFFKRITWLKHSFFFSLRAMIKVFWKRE